MKSLFSLVFSSGSVNHWNGVFPGRWLRRGSGSACPCPGTVCSLDEWIRWENVNPLPPPTQPVYLIEAVLLRKSGFLSGKTVRALLRNSKAVSSGIWESLKYRQGLNRRVFSSPRACVAGYVRNSLKACCKHENTTNQQGAQEKHCFCNKSPRSLSVCHKGTAEAEIKEHQ